MKSSSDIKPRISAYETVDKFSSQSAGIAKDLQSKYFVNGNIPDFDRTGDREMVLKLTLFFIFKCVDSAKTL